MATAAVALKKDSNGDLELQNAELENEVDDLKKEVSKLTEELKTLKGDDLAEATPEEKSNFANII